MGVNRAPPLSRAPKLPDNARRADGTSPRHGTNFPFPLAERSSIGCPRGKRASGRSVVSTSYVVAALHGKRTKGVSSEAP